MQTLDYNAIALKLDEWLERMDAPRKTKTGETKQCGRGWEGTNPPGCTRAKKGEAKGKSTAKSKPKSAIEGLDRLKSSLNEAKPKPGGAVTTETKARQSKKTKPESSQVATVKDDIESLRKSYKPAQYGGNIASDIGNMTYSYADEINSSGKPSTARVKAFKNGETNWNPAIVTLKKSSVGSGEESTAIGERSNKDVQSAMQAGKNARLTTIGIPDNPKDIAVAKALDVPDTTKLVAGKFDRDKKGDLTSNVGDYYHSYADEITGYKGKGHNASDAEVEAAAKLMLKNNTRNWVPVLIKKTGKDKFEVVGNHFAYDVAKKAGIDRIWTIEVPSDSKAVPQKPKSTKKTDSKPVKSLLDFVRGL